MKRFACGVPGTWAAAVMAMVMLGGCTTLLGVDKEYHGVNNDGTGGATSSSGETGGAMSSSAGTGGAMSSTSGAGGATGGCVPLTDKRCAGNLPQSCDASGQWQNEAACSTQMPVCTAGACGVPPSCSGLPPTCGPGGNESCCATTAIAGGIYNRGNDNTYPAMVSDFRLDRFEITVGRFRQFVASYPGNKPAAGAGANPLIGASGWQPAWNASLAADQAGLSAGVKCDPTYQTWTDAVDVNENKPMNCIDWFEAFAFCAWDGGRLPTEAEWNYAAAGGDEQRSFAWGAAPVDPAHAVYSCTGDGSPSGQCAATDILNVGTKSMLGDGKWEQSDLAGSVGEWTLDWFESSYANPCNNCGVLSQGGFPHRVFRGGSWYSNASFMLTSVRFHDDPSTHDDVIGVRCARIP